MAIAPPPPSNEPLTRGGATGVPIGYTVGDSGWTKGNVRIVQGDFDCDGVLDAVVSAASGPPAGTWYWRGSYAHEYSMLVHWRVPTFTAVTQLDASATPRNSMVFADNFMGDARQCRASS